MRDEDAPRFAALITKLCVAFDRTPSDSLVEVYFDALADLSIAQVEQAVAAAIRACRFFPKPIEMRELIAGSITDHAEAGWSLFVDAIRVVGHYNSIWIDDSAMTTALQSVFGGWLQATEQMNSLSEEMRTAKRKEFLATYRMAETRGEGAARYFIGASEANNRASAGSWRRGTGGTSVQPVGVIADCKVHIVRLEFSLVTGELTSSARALLEQRRYAGLLAQRKPSALPAPNEDEGEPVSLAEAIAAADGEQRLLLQELARAQHGNVLGFTREVAPDDPPPSVQSGPGIEHGLIG